MSADEPPELLPGRSALEEDLLDVRARIVGLIVLPLILVAAGVLDSDARWVAIPVLAVPLFAAAVISSRAQMAALRVRRRERDAGYTSEYGRGGADLWQLDPKTGIVIRRPGEQISKAEARRRADAPPASRAD